MRKIYLPMFLLCLFATAFAQQPLNKLTPALQTRVTNASADEELLVWIYFTDKGENTDYYLNHPLTVVSEKSLKRREKVLSQSAPLTVKDLPVSSAYLSQVKALGLNVKWPSKWLNAVSGTLNKSAVNEIAALPFVKKLDIVYKLKKGYQPDTDKNLISQTLAKVQQPAGIHSFDYGDSYSQLQQINVPAVHDLGYTGQGITICLMDPVSADSVTMHFCR
jgi:serine protease AprX